MELFILKQQIKDGLSETAASQDVILIWDEPDHDYLYHMKLIGESWESNIFKMLEFYKEKPSHIAVSLEDSLILHFSKNIESTSLQFMDDEFKFEFDIEHAKKNYNLYIKDQMQKWLDHQSQYELSKHNYPKIISIPTFCAHEDDHIHKKIRLHLKTTLQKKGLIVHEKDNNFILTLYPSL